MNLSVEYIDQAGTVSNRSYRMTRLAFAKHMAVAGQGYAPSLKKLLRTIGMCFHYSYYVHRNAFDNDRFSEPPTALSDPTEKGHFSNLAGKAIADYLSKRIDHSLFTVNYEAVMRIQGHKLVGRRPDLFAYSQRAMFALEAKGRHQNSPGNMATHKAQAQAGPIPVNFSIACISYNLFNRVTCNYYDPFNENIIYDNASLQALTRNYYKGLSEYLNRKWFTYREVEFQGELFYEVELSRQNYERLLPAEFPFRSYWEIEFLEFYRPRLILPAAIGQFSETGITNETTPFLFEYNSQEENLYIDNDRVGLIIGR